MTAKTIKFMAELTKTGTNTTGIIIPPTVIDELDAGKRPAVVVKVNDYTYRTTVGTMRGHSMLPFSASHRAESGLSGGDAIEVELSVDTAPRETKIPDDLAKALSAAGALEGAFRKQAPSRQRADVESVSSAKASETRARRIAAIVDRLKG